MPHRIGVERDDLFQPDRGDIEQTAVEIEILEMKHRVVGKSARVIAEDQLAVTLLHLLVIGDRIIAEGAGDENNERREEQRCRQVMTISAREPRPKSTRQTRAAVAARKPGRTGEAFGAKRVRERLRYMSSPARHFSRKSNSVPHQSCCGAAMIKLPANY